MQRKPGFIQYALNLSALSALLLLSTVISAYGSNPIEILTSAFRTGDSRTIAGFFEKSVDLTLMDKEADYSASQAELMLKDFFQKNPPKSFQLVHQGSNKGASFAIGTLITSNGRHFRVSFHLQQTEGKNILQEISVQDE
ncbi:MAG: DUF4783 domain-containing protein [Bacteroidota bacterium]